MKVVMSLLTYLQKLCVPNKEDANVKVFNLITRRKL